MGIIRHRRMPPRGRTDRLPPATAGHHPAAAALCALAGLRRQRRRRSRADHAERARSPTGTSSIQRRDILVWTLAIAHNAFMDERRRDKRASWVDAEDVIDALPAVGNDLGLRIGPAGRARQTARRAAPAAAARHPRTAPATPNAPSAAHPGGHGDVAHLARAATLRDLLDGRAPRTPRGLRRVV